MNNSEYSDSLQVCITIKHYRPHSLEDASIRENHNNLVHSSLIKMKNVLCCGMSAFNLDFYYAFLTPD